MTRTTNETLAARAIWKALNVNELAPHSVAYLICMWTPSMQIRFWRICQSFMAQTPIGDIIDEVEEMRN